MTAPSYVTFIRHGESESNVAGRWQGHGDSPLSARGREQAVLLGKRMAGARVDRVFASDLQRAHDTGKALGHPITVEQRWREIDVGAWEGLTRAEVKEKFPEEIAALGRGEMVPIGRTGESWLMLAARIDAALADLRSTLKPGEHVVVATHGGVVASVVSGLFATRGRRPSPLGRIQNTAMTTIEFRGDDARMVRFCDASHVTKVNAWAEERQVEHGDTLVILVTPQDAASVEKIASWYHADEVFAAKSEHATRLGAAWDVGVSSVVDDVGEAVGTLRKTRPGKRVALVADPVEARAYLNKVIGCDAIAQARGIHTLTRSDRHASIIDSGVTRAFAL